MREVLNELGITQWKLRNAPDDGSNLVVVEHCNESKLAVKEDKSLICIVLDDKSFTKYQAKDASTLKFLSHLTLYLQNNYHSVEVKPVSATRELSCSLLILDGENQEANHSYTIDQLFLYPERKKGLFRKLTSSIAKI